MSGRQFRPEQTRRYPHQFSGAPAWVLDELVAAGFDLFATATNHVLDYSISGLLHTIEALEARGLSFAGVGRNLEDARRPCYHTSPAGSVAMISCCSTFAKGNEAGAQRPDLPGRPGLNLLHVEVGSRSRISGGGWRAATLGVMTASV